jgi:hypothetical protein
MEGKLTGMTPTVHPRLINERLLLEEVLECECRYNFMKLTLQKEGKNSYPHHEGE